MRKLSLQRFAFYCPICGWNSLGEYHGPISHFPAIKKLPNKFAVSVKCPWCGRRRVMAICPKCGLKTPAYKIFKISKRTGRIRQIWDGETLIATLNPISGLLNLTIEGAKRLVKNGGAVSQWVKVRDDAAIFVEKGKDVFAKHVVDADREIRPMEETVVLNSRGEVIAVGKAVLSGVEMLEFTRGVAVKVRRGRIQED